ncbi:MAG: type II CAAX endopeptidase family protein [Actinomycetota bacterium]|nr:type II CAAX endopeptidase family protein [Actinomycetota bacterium]
MEGKRVSWTILDIFKVIFFTLVIMASCISAFFIARLWINFSLPSNIIGPLEMLLIYAALFLSVLFFGPKTKGARLSELRLVKFNFFKAASASITWLLAIKLSTGLYVTLTENLFGLGPPQDNFELIPKIFGDGMAGFILAVLLMVIVAPVVEEIFFRGFIYPALRDKIGMVWAATTSSFIFALFHGDAWLIVPIMMLGIVLVHLFEKQESLWPSILLHSMYNLMTVVIIYLLEV